MCASAPREALRPIRTRDAGSRRHPRRPLNGDGRKRWRIASVHQHGGPEVSATSTAPDPGPGEGLVRHEAIGLNYIDVYFRTGLYPRPAACIASDGRCGRGRGSRSGRHRPVPRPAGRLRSLRPTAPTPTAVMPADKLVPLPDAISFETAAAMMLKGMTAQYLLRQTYPVSPATPVPVPWSADLRPWAKVPRPSAPWAREGRARVGARLRPRDRLQARGFRRQKEITGAGGGGLRRRGPSTFLKSLDCRSPAAWGSASATRRVGRELQPRRPQRQGLALRHQAD